MIYFHHIDKFSSHWYCFNFFITLIHLHHSDIFSMQWYIFMTVMNFHHILATLSIYLLTIVNFIIIYITNWIWKNFVPTSASTLSVICYFLYPISFGSWFCIVLIYFWVLSQTNWDNLGLLLVLFCLILEWTIFKWSIITYLLYVLDFCCFRFSFFYLFFFSLFLIFLLFFCYLLVC